MQPHPAVASPARQRTLNKPRPTSAAVSICTEHGLRQSSGSNPAAGAGGSPPWHLGWIGTGAGCEVERSQVGRPPAPSAPQPEGIPSSVSCATLLPAVLGDAGPLCPPAVDKQRLPKLWPFILVAAHG